MRASIITVAFGSLVIAAAAMVAPAGAGEVISTAAGRRVRWARDEIVLNVVQPSTRASISGEVFTHEIGEAVATWNRALEGTRAPRFRIGSSDGRAIVDRVGHNGQSIIVLQTARRCSRDVSDDTGCYAEERNAITHVYPDESGIVDDADIEINGVDVDWRPGGAGADAPRLRAVLVHELGHALGLDHSCGSVSTHRALCSSPEAKRSLMYPDTLEAGRSLVLAPGPDEQTTLRAVYGERRGCSCAENPASSRPRVGLEWLILVGWVLLKKNPDEREPKRSASPDNSHWQRSTRVRAPTSAGS